MRRLGRKMLSLFPVLPGLVVYAVLIEHTAPMGLNALSQPKLTGKIVLQVIAQTPYIVYWWVPGDRVCFSPLGRSSRAWVFSGTVQVKIVPPCFFSQPAEIIP